ncbi:MAG: TAXI family TRAP transporter solute-binding subunit [Aquisalimonadaceae bacterium]
MFRTLITRPLVSRAACLAFTLAAGLASASADAQNRNLTIGGGAVGGTWTVIGTAIGDYVSREVSDVRTTVIAGGGVKNILGLSMDQLQLGFAYSSTAGEALTGTGPFEKGKLPVMAVAGFYYAPWQLAVRADSDIHTIKDLKGKGFSPGIKGFTGEVISRMVLGVNDMSYDDLARVEYIDYNDSVNLIKDRHLDAFCPIAADPTPSIQELAASADGVRIVSLSDEEIKAIREINPGYATYPIPKDRYEGMTEDSQTIAANTVLYVSPEVSPELVKKILEVMFDRVDDLRSLHPLMKNFSAENAVKDLGAPLHPGAEAFYKERGLL